MGFLTSGVVVFGLIFASAGAAQVMGGIYFVFAISSYETWSYVWSGLWDVLCGILFMLLGCFGEMSTGRLQTLLVLSVIAGIANAINMVIMEVGEWTLYSSRKALHPLSLEAIRRQEDSVLSYAYLSTTVSTAVALVTAFVCCQYIFCFLYRQEKQKKEAKDALLDSAKMDSLFPLSRALALNEAEPGFLQHYYGVRSLIRGELAAGGSAAEEFRRSSFWEGDPFIRRDDTLLCPPPPRTYARRYGSIFAEFEKSPQSGSQNGAGRGRHRSRLRETSDRGPTVMPHSVTPGASGVEGVQKSAAVLLSPRSLSSASSKCDGNDEDYNCSTFILNHYFHSQKDLLMGRISPSHSDNVHYGYTLERVPSWKSVRDVKDSNSLNEVRMYTTQEKEESVTLLIN
ncbi:unnamed protein product [Cyprideis torosa]|uniref:Uncharacterized protein n=1 Tax=Cyprideis torosa TaxID=163714 RepID=A0A7R8W7Q4_9CRUS|nr:unnamed protein product [Cyprideis torosa]CAG0887808.1 unnamed protein product [Cyprideis torosa]